MNEELIQLLDGEGLDPEAEASAFERLAEGSDPNLLQQFSRHLMLERNRLRREVAQAKVALKKARARSEEAQVLLQKITQPPLQPAIVLYVCQGGRLDVATQGGRRIVGVHETLDASALRAGEEVYLDPESGIAVSRGDTAPRAGRVATVIELLGERLLVRGEGEQDRTVLCDGALAREIEVGDRVLLAGDVPCVLERLPARRHSSHLLQSPPQVGFDDLGGLDALTRELREELELHLFQPALVRRYALPLLRGMTLVGPPGVGKTMVARALAGFLASEAPDTRFMNVAPGSLRGSYYGQTEARIRELFAVARAEPGLVVMFFDELDTFGARGSSPGHDIDDRVMGTLLAEIDGLEPSDGIFVIGATNRLELIDDAIVRQGRFGDRIVDVPRPNRAGARAILAGLLHADLPWAETARPELAVAAAVSFLFAPAGGAGPLVQLTFADGSRQDVHARDVMSGALLASSVREAKRHAAIRQLTKGPGLCEADVVDALDRALDAEARKLSAVAVARRSLTLARANEITGVALPTERCVGATTRLRAA